MKTNIDIWDEEEEEEAYTQKELYIYSLTNLPQTTHAHTMAASQAYFYIFISDVDFVCYVRENVILSRLM